MHDAQEVKDMNIPNFLTLIRFLLIPLFIYYFFSSSSNGLHISIMVFLLAGFTDMLDGYIARKYKMITRLGTALDPLADKLMILTVLVSISIRFPIPLYIIAIVIIKEVMMIMGAIALYNDHDVVVPANRLGKLSTIIFYAAVLAVAFGWPISRWLLHLFIGVTVLALVVYLANFITIRKHNKIHLVKK